MVLLTSKKDGPNSAIGTARGALPASVTSMTSTAANLLHRDVISLAGVMAGSDGARQAREVFNYGDMLFHEGQRDLIARQRAHEAAAEVEDPECTFKPKISELAESFGDRGHMGDRAAALEQPALAAAAAAAARGWWRCRCAAHRLQSRWCRQRRRRGSAKLSARRCGPPSCASLLAS